MPLAEFEADAVYGAERFASALVSSTWVHNEKMDNKHTDCLTSGRASGCERRLCCGYIAAADACDHLLDFMSIHTTDSSEVCRVWLLLDGREKACRRHGKDAARKGEERDKDGDFAGEHVESRRLLVGGWSRKLLLQWVSLILRSV